jgi:hypothetical protein
MMVGREVRARAPWRLLYSYCRLVFSFWIVFSFKLRPIPSVLAAGAQASFSGFLPFNDLSKSEQDRTSPKHYRIVLTSRTLYVDRVSVQSRRVSDGRRLRVRPGARCTECEFGELS